MLVDFRSQIIFNRILYIKLYRIGGGKRGHLAQSDSDGNSQNFNVNRDDNGKRYLNYNWYHPDNHFSSDNSFLFARKYFFPQLCYGLWFFLSGLLRLFFHPPVIFPISFSFKDISSYCL